MGFVRRVRTEQGRAPEPADLGAKPVFQRARPDTAGEAGQVGRRRLRVPLPHRWRSCTRGPSIAGVYMPSTPVSEAVFIYFSIR